MTKYRSKNDYAQIYGGDKQGFNTGLEGFLYLRKETTARSFLPPRIGTQGKSVGAAAAITDISALTSPTLKIALRGAAALSVTLTPAGNTTGTLVAAALESAINTALQAIGSDHRVWTLFASGDSHYEIYDQETGVLSSVVITDGVTNDVAAALKLGTTHAGVETVGTDDSDYLLMTTGGPKYMQTVESNQHRSGRFHSGIVKKKKTAEFDFETYVNMGGTAGASIDNSIALLLENVLGTKVVNSGTNIIFTQGLPNFTMSLVRVSTIFGEYYTGSYTKGMELKFPLPPTHPTSSPLARRGARRRGFLAKCNRRGVGLRWRCPRTRTTPSRHTSDTNTVCSWLHLPDWLSCRDHPVRLHNHGHDVDGLLCGETNNDGVERSQALMDGALHRRHHAA